MSPSDLDGFDTMTITLAGPYSLAVSPRQYGYLMHDGVYCLGVFDNGHNSVVIGGATMRGHEVQDPRCVLMHATHSRITHRDRVI